MMSRTDPGVEHAGTSLRLVLFPTVVLVPRHLEVLEGRCGDGIVLDWDLYRLVRPVVGNCAATRLSSSFGFGTSDAPVRDSFELAPGAGLPMMRCRRLRAVSSSREDGPPAGPRPSCSDRCRAGDAEEAGWGKRPERAGCEWCLAMPLQPLSDASRTIPGSDRPVLLVQMDVLRPLPKPESIGAKGRTRRGSGTHTVNLRGYSAFLVALQTPEGHLFGQRLDEQLGASGVVDERQA